MVTHGWQIVCKLFNGCIHSLLCSPLLAKYSENENLSGVVMLEAAETRSLLHYARCLTLLLLLGFRLQRTFPFAKCSYSSLFLPIFSPTCFFDLRTKLSLKASNGLFHHILWWLLTVLVREYFLLWIARRKAWMRVKSIFIGPRSDHSLPMSVTNWLTHSLTDDLVEDLMNWPLLMESNI